MQVIEGGYSVLFLRSARAPGSAESLGSLMKDISSALRAALPARWGEYLAPAYSIKPTLPDISLPNNKSPFDLVFDRKTRTTLDNSVPQEDDSEWIGAGIRFIEQGNRR